MKNRARLRRLRWLVIPVVVVVAIGLLIPSRQVIPVAGATLADWNHQTFWHHPWGRSGVHKGTDVFAPRGTPVIASTGGIVLYSGELALGGKVVSILGPTSLSLHVHRNRRWVVGQLGLLEPRGELRGRYYHLSAATYRRLGRRRRTCGRGASSRCSRSRWCSSTSRSMARSRGLRPPSCAS